MDYLTTLLKLMQVPNFGAFKINNLLNNINFSDFLQFNKADLQQLNFNDNQIHKFLHPDMKIIDKALKWQETKGNHIITLFDDEYPFLLSQISTPPPILFVKGSTSVLSENQIAMVGSRDFSNYGEHWAREFAKRLWQHNIVVTSGLAIGIDGFCHQEVVNNQGKTIAVLGSGLDNIYPKRHISLSDKITEFGGALVSEFLPDTPPIAQNFPRRNRIISGLSVGTLVVEATIKSGSLITARYALEQGREVFAIPNSIQNFYTAGCHKLIKDGAILVDDIDDILETLAFSFHTKNFNKQTLQKSSKISPLNLVSKPSSGLKNTIIRNYDQLDAEQRKMIEPLSLTPLSTDDWARVMKIDVSDLLVKALELELLGVIKAVSGGYITA